MARWIELLAEFNFVVQHCPGTKHGNADALSKRAEKDNEIETEEKQEVSVIEKTGVVEETVREGERKRTHEATRSEVMSDGAKEFFNWLGAEVELVAISITGRYFISSLGIREWQEG